MKRLLRTPAFAGGAILVLGLSIGLTLPVLSLAEGGLLRDFIFVNPPELLGVEEHGGILGWTPRASTPAEHQGNRLDALLLTLAVLTGFVLAIGSVNLAILLSSRAAGRRRELAIRAAVGARWSQLARQLMREAGLLGACGLTLGLLVGFIGIASLQLSWPDGLPAWLAGLPKAFAASASVGAPLAVTLLFGLFPILGFWRGDLRSRLTTAQGVTAGIIEGFVRRALLFLSIAATALLLTNAILLVRAGSPNSTAGDANAAPTHTLAMTVTLPAADTSDANAPIGFYDALLEQIGEIPGVHASSISSAGTLEGMGVVDRDLVDCGGCSIGGAYVPIFPEDVRHHAVGPSYFDTVGVSLVSGREFTEVDRIGAPPVAMVNEAFAMRSFERGQPIGRGVRLHGEDGEWYTVVGVVPNTDPPGIGIGDEPVPVMYVSALHHPPTVADLFVRVDDETDPVELAPTIAAAVAGLTPGAVVSEASTVADRLDRSVAPLRWFSRVLTLVAAAAIILSAMTLYGVTAYTVRTRTREIGIRMAIGARTGQVTMMVLGQALRLTLLATLIGLGAALGLARMLQQLFLGVRPLDVAIYAAVAALLVVVAMLAAFVPARRAATVDPAVAFRPE